MDALEQKIHYTFRDPLLLRGAMTHSSYANESRDGSVRSNERLEFLGDSVLGLMAAEYLYGRFSELEEGDLTRMRATLVCEQSLVAAAAELDLGRWLLLGRGEEMGGGRGRTSLLADATEALIGALYLDGGAGPARDFVHRFILERGLVDAQPSFVDYKTTLQELIQRDPQNELCYRLAGETGPDHAKVFIAEALLNGSVIGRGEGSSKKEAEQAAAAAGLKRLE